MKALSQKEHTQTALDDAVKAVLENLSQPMKTFNPRITHIGVLI
jgi:hypothetical protein